jgi:hypothetical protein
MVRRVQTVVICAVARPIHGGSSGFRGLKENLSTVFLNLVLNYRGKLNTMRFPSCWRQRLAKVYGFRGARNALRFVL